jgi:hypothetical protein
MYSAVYPRPHNFARRETERQLERYAYTHGNCSVVREMRFLGPWVGAGNKGILLRMPYQEVLCDIPES